MNVRNNPVTAHARRLAVPLVAKTGRIVRGISGRRSRHRVGGRVVGSVASAAAAGISSTISTTKGTTSGAGAYWARTPPSRGPSPRPPAVATVDTSAALPRLPTGSSSVNAAINGPDAAPRARPCRIRAAKSHPVPVASANPSDPSAAKPTAGISTRRRPIASDNEPATSRHGISTATYEAKISVRTNGENPKRSS